MAHLLYGVEMMLGPLDAIMLDLTFVQKCSNNSLWGRWMKL